MNNTLIPCKVDPFVGVWGNFPASSGPFGRRFIRHTSVQQTLLQQEDSGRLLKTHQARGADGCWIQLLQLLILVAHFLQNVHNLSKDEDITHG